MRLFIAFKLPEEVSDYLHKIQRELPNAQMKMVQDFHLTLQFLGWVPDEKVEEIKKALAQAESFKVNPWVFELAEMGLFKKGRFPRVIWVDLKIPEEVFGLQKKIAESLRPLGFVPDKPFVPHLTLARVKFCDRPFEFEQKINEIFIKSLEFEVKNFYLIKSTLTPKGSIYEEVAEFKI